MRSWGGGGRGRRETGHGDNISLCIVLPDTFPHPDLGQIIGGIFGSCVLKTREVRKFREPAVWKLETANGGEEGLAVNAREVVSQSDQNTQSCVRHLKRKGKKGPSLSLSISKGKAWTDRNVSSVVVVK